MKAMNTDNGEWIYQYLKLIRPDLIGTDMINYVESLKAENKELRKQLNLVKDEMLKRNRIEKMSTS